ncbi:bile acid:sodium symporter family protein [Sulfuriflexus sp.]|uniref:bile acid:sodium symporter family protein n=1 Tax=Sulfuriflexus sp. TaxID=2015443 RepID=UPI0028CDD2D5|nr:bile acid:sodium symporter family protein [Sulfuriflexus sp.]MDT8404306.1 bile acid:sodium symporter family protein [Sulfuriflexus sp.]
MYAFTRLFPLWALSLSALAYFLPAPFLAIKAAIVPLLAVIMLSMGLTLSMSDFRLVLKRPGLIGLGMLLQYGVMPFAAYGIARQLELGTELLVGMVLVGASAGGTASNVICYLARGDVALSITLTTISTLLAVILLPGLSWLYLGQVVTVPVADMLISIIKIVILPVTIGVTINTLLPRLVRKIQPVFPVVAIAAIVLIIAIVTALNNERLGSVGPLLLLAVVLHNLTGLLCGYGVAGLLGFDARIRRTLAIEVGMQNSGLSVALAIKYFSATAALPGALFSIWHNISGSLLASWWSRKRRRK